MLSKQLLGFTAVAGQREFLRPCGANRLQHAGYSKEYLVYPIPPFDRLPAAFSSEYSEDEGLAHIS